MELSSDRLRDDDDDDDGKNIGCSLEIMEIKITVKKINNCCYDSVTLKFAFN